MLIRTKRQVRAAIGQRRPVTDFGNLTAGALAWLASELRAGRVHQSFDVVAARPRYHLPGCANNTPAHHPTRATRRSPDTSG